MAQTSVERAVVGVAVDAPQPQVGQVGQPRCPPAAQRPGKSEDDFGITIPARRRTAASRPLAANRRITLIAAEVFQDGVVQQPLCPVRRPVPAMPSDAPPVHPGHLADQRRHILVRL